MFWPDTSRGISPLVMMGLGVMEASQGQPAGRPGPSFAGALAGAGRGFGNWVQYDQQRRQQELQNQLRRDAFGLQKRRVDLEDARLAQAIQAEQARQGALGSIDPTRLNDPTYRAQLLAMEIDPAKLSPSTKPPQTRTRNLPGGMQVSEAWNGQQWVPEGKPYARWQPPRPTAVGSKIGTYYVDGKPRLMTEQEALAAQQGGSLVSTHKPGKGGFVVETGPDGRTTVRMGGEDVPSQASDPVQARRRLEEIATITNQMAALADAGAAHSDEYLGFFPKAKNAGLVFLDNLVGLDPSGESAEWVEGRQAFATHTEQFFNDYRRIITGAAASVAELDALRKTMINMDLSPAQFRSMYKAYMSKLERGLSIAQSMLSKNPNATDEEIGRAVDAVVRVNPSLLPKSVRDRYAQELDLSKGGIQRATPAEPIGPPLGSQPGFMSSRYD